MPVIIQRIMVQKREPRWTGKTYPKKGVKALEWSITLPKSGGEFYLVGISLQPLTLTAPKNLSKLIFTGMMKIEIFDERTGHLINVPLDRVSSLMVGQHDPQKFYDIRVQKKRPWHVQPGMTMSALATWPKPVKLSKPFPIRCYFNGIKLTWEDRKMEREQR